MNEPPSPDTLVRWLNDATRGLPANIAWAVRRELESHYLDAFDAHCQEGMPPDEAARAALAELGDAAEVDAQLRAAHPSRTRLVIAMLACLLYPLALILMPWTESTFGSTIALLAQDAVSVLVIAYVLVTFVSLLGFDTARLARPAALVVAGLVLNLLDRQIFYVIFHQLPLVGPNDTVFWDTSSALPFLMNLVFLVSDVLTSLAVLWLGLRMLRLPERLFGLQRPAAYLLVVTAIIGLLVVSALLVPDVFLAGLFSTLGYAAVTIELAVMILAFFRAAFRPSSMPLKAA